MEYISNALKEAYYTIDYCWFFLILFLPFLGAAFIMRFSETPVRKKCGRAALITALPGAAAVVFYIVTAVRIFAKYLGSARADGTPQLITSDHPSLKALEGMLNNVSATLYFLEAFYVPLCGLFLAVTGFIIWKSGRKLSLFCILWGVLMSASLILYLSGLRGLVY